MKEENQKPQSQTSDEIDLKELFNSIGNFFKSIFINIILLFVYLRNATLNNLRLIIICVLLGGVVGISLNYVSTDYYKSSMVLKSVHLTGRLMESSIDKINQLAQEKSFEQLAKVIKIDPETAKDIRSFSYEPFVSEDEIVELEVFKEQLRSEIDDEETINKFVERLKNENRNTYRISVEVYNNKIIRSLEEPLVSYFRNNQYVQKRLEISEQNLLKERENITEEMNKLDSLKSLIFQNFNSLSTNKTGSNNVILAEENIANPIDVIEKLKENYKDLLRVNKQLYLNEEFELIDGFLAYQIPESPGLMKYGFYSGLVGLGIAYLIIALLAFNSYLNKIESSYANKKD